MTRKRRRDMADLLEIMVVEDDQHIQRIVEETLSDGGFEPVIASSGEEALALLRTLLGAPERPIRTCR
jgi:DNA-binding NtrC family response regulator